MRNVARDRRLDRRHPKKNIPYERRERPGHNPLRPLAAFFFFGLKAILVAAVFGGIGYGLVALYQGLTTSRYFVIRDVEVAGNERLEYHDIVRQAGLTPGQNSLSVSIDSVEAALKKNPWIKAVSVTRKLPDMLKIVIEERVPRFWVRKNETMYYADVSGDVIAPVDSVRFVSLPILEMEEGEPGEQRQFAQALRVLGGADLPVAVDRAAWIQAGKENGIVLCMENTGLLLGIGLEGFSANLGNLKKVLEDLNERGELGMVREAHAYGTNVWVRFDASRTGGA